MISLLLDPESHLEQQLHRYEPMNQHFCKSSSDRYVARYALLSSRLLDFRALNKFSDCSPFGYSFGACRKCNQLLSKVAIKCDITCVVVCKMFENRCHKGICVISKSATTL